MHQPRRRRLPLTPLDNVTGSPQESHEGKGEKLKNKKVRKRRKRRRRSAGAKFRRRIILWAVLSAALIASTIWKIQRVSLISLGSEHISSLKGNLRSKLSSSAISIPEYQLAHHALYDAVRHSTNRTQNAIPSYEKRTFALTSTYGVDVTEQGCNLTVVFMDPRLATSGHGDSAWFSLESVAAFSPDACVLLQTATCAVQEQLESTQGFLSKEAALGVVAERVYEYALPLFRNMIEQGRVRVTVPDHTKYNLKSCSDYGNPSSAFMNIHYWNDEFIGGVDSDLVLFIQDDAVLCHSFDINDYKDFAFVGSVWSKKSFQLSEGLCDGMPIRWSSWVAPQKRWERQQKRISSIPVEKRLPRPDVLLNVTFPDVCNGGLGPVGNGGLSLRSRSWAVKAIETCPHSKYSAVDDVNERARACKVVEVINEDLYFAIVLRGIGAPLPSAYKASLFSTEMLWPEQVEDMFGARQGESSDQERRQIHFDGQLITVPAAVHKPWWYHSSELLLSAEMDGACPFLQYVFPSEQTGRWKEWQSLRANKDKQHWQGIGA